MCIIAIKPAGTKFPSDSLFATMWTNNPDGAGLMYTDKGKVCIRKGFMKYDEFQDAVDAIKASNIDLDKTPFVFHFRITTHGGTRPENCHPFAITDNVAILQKPLVYTDVGVAHNGIIHIIPRANISDTMEYIVSQLSIVKALNRKFYENTRFLKLIENAIDSKMAFLAGDGTVTTVGQFVTDDVTGMIFSNTSYKPLVSYSKYDTATAISYPYYYGYDGLVKRVDDDDAGVAKALMCLSDAESKRPIRTKNGSLLDLDAYAIDKKGRLYRIDYDTGCAYRDTSVSLAEKLKFNVNKADHYTTYKSYSDMCADVYGVSATLPSSRSPYSYDDDDYYSKFDLWD